MPRANCNGIEIEYEVRGQGEPLLLVMGIGSQITDWADGMLDAIEAAGYQLILFDNRDMGFSQRVEGSPAHSVAQLVLRGLFRLKISTPYTLNDMADDAAGLLDHLGHASAHILGTSLGGMIAQTFAIRHPSRTRSLTSIMSSAGRRRNALGTIPALRALLSPAPNSRDEAMDRSCAFVKVCGSKAWPTDWDAVRHLAARSYDRSADGSGFFRQFAAVVASGSRYHALRQVAAPTCVIHGSIDPLLRPAGGKDTARAIPGATLRMVEGMGHDLPAPFWPILVDELKAVTEKTKC